jgi:hypothetical protein
MKLRHIKGGQVIPQYSLIEISNRGFAVCAYGDVPNIGIAGELLTEKYIELADNGMWVNSDYKENRMKDLDDEIASVVNDALNKYRELMNKKCDEMLGMLNKGSGADKPNPDLIEYLNRGDR